MQLAFPNPERLWHAQREQVVNVEEVQRRLGGHAMGPFRPLGGGLANDNILLPDDRVLRIYRRDAEQLPLEEALLGITWESFRVPRALDRGADFLLLEYVAHDVLDGSQATGQRVGRALREIQERTFIAAGSLDASLQLVEPWPDFPQMMIDYVEKQVTRTAEVQSLLSEAAGWLVEHQGWLAAAAEAPTLLHGDFKASNLHLTAAGELLVLDWEFCYAGPPWMDVGQLFRWGAPVEFQRGFEQTFPLAQRADWCALAQAFDVVNLVGLLAKAKSSSRQFTDCCHGLRQRLAWRPAS